MSKAKQKQRKEQAKQQAIKNAEREVQKDILSSNGSSGVFYGAKKDRLVVDLRKIDVSNDKALVTGLYAAFGLPIPDDLVAKYNLEQTKSNTGDIWKR